MKWLVSLRNYFGFNRFVRIPVMVSGQAVIMQEGYISTRSSKVGSITSTSTSSGSGHESALIVTHQHNKMINKNQPDQSDFFSQRQVYDTPETIMVDSLPSTTSPVAVAATKLKASVPLFFKGKLSSKGIKKTGKDGKVKRQPKSLSLSYFCNTAIKESEISDVLATELDLKVDESGKKADAYLRIPGYETATKLEFVIVPQKVGKAYNLGSDALRRMRVLVDPSAGVDPSVLAARALEKKTKEVTEPESK